MRAWERRVIVLIKAVGLSLAVSVLVHIHAARIGILPVRILLHVAILTVRIGLLLLLHICFLRLAIGTGRGSVAILPVRRAGIIALVCISGRAVGLLIILARLARVLICAGGGIAAVVAGGGLIILPRLAVRLLITLARIIPGVKRGNAALRCAWCGGGLGLLRRGSLRLRHGFRLCGGGFPRALRHAWRAYGPGLFFGFGLGLDGGKLAAAVHDDIDKFTLAIFGDGFNTLKLCDLSQIA